MITQSINNRRPLSTTENLQEVNDRLINFVCDTFEIDKEKFILSKKEKVCEFKLYIFYILKNSFGATSREIAKIYSISAHEVNRKLRTLTGYLEMGFYQESYFITLKFLERVYVEQICPLLTYTTN